MIFKYAVNNYFDDEDHLVLFPHFFSAFIYALRIKSKVIKLGRKE